MRKSRAIRIPETPFAFLLVEEETEEVPAPAPGKEKKGKRGKWGAIRIGFGGEISVKPFVFPNAFLQGFPKPDPADA